MADQEVKIRISTDASGAVTTASPVGKIKTHWLGFSAAIAGVAVGAQQN